MSSEGRIAAGREAYWMLNIGLLRQGAADYYVGEIAKSPEDYYLGHGEAAGRWVGSLSERLGLSGEVTELEFRRLLDGCHPCTGERLVSAIGSSERANRRRRGVPPGEPGLFDGEHLDVSRTAARLRLSTRHVRRLLMAGARWRTTPADQRAAPGTSCLVGEQVRSDGRMVWRLNASEVERFESERRHTKARPGYDLTLRPPKSVSILWALGDEQQRRIIRRAHREAVDAVVAYYEGQAIFARRGRGRREHVLNGGLVAAAFDHRTSRASDPLLHSHVVVANMTETVEGRWQALDSRSLYRHARSGGYVYQAQLRHALTRDAGLAWRPVINGYADVEGVPDDVIRAFSKRSDEIEDLMAESGYTSARARQAATLDTRKPKDHSLTPDTLQERWREEAAEFGFAAQAVNACFRRDAPVPVTPEATDRFFDRLAGPYGLTREASTFTRREVVESLATALGPGVDAEEIGVLADRFLASDRVVVLDPPDAHRRPDVVIGPGGRRIRTAGSVRYSTPDLLGVEAQVLQWADRGFGHPVPTAKPDAVDAALAQRPELSAEQVEMVRAVCLADQAIQPIAGRPGAGKTYAADACVEAFLASGIPVVGCALSATAAAELEATTSLGPATGRPATTIARLLGELDDPVSGGFAPGTVLFVDEASMVGTRDLARLGAHLARAGGAMKLIGDPDQHGPVETGGVFRRLVDDAGDSVVSLVDNNRQCDEGERLAIEEYRNGQIATALARYDDAGKIVRAPTAAACYDAMAADWLVARRHGCTDPMIAGPNSTRRALNARARALLKAEGELSGPAIVVAGREFMVGDWVVTRHNDRRLTADGSKAFVKNGSVGVVAEVDELAKELVVDFAREGRIRLPHSYLDAGWVEHGYARTTYGVQGATLDETHYHPGDESRFEEGYVALTRDRRRTRLYIVDGHRLASDLDHRGHDPKASGLDTVAAALEQRQARSLAHEADGAAAARVQDRSRDLRSLRLEREALEGVLAEAPSSSAETLLAARRHRDALLTRRQLWETRLAEAANTLTGTKGRDSRASADVTAAEREVARVDKALAAIDTRIAYHETRQADRAAFLADHAQEIARVDLLRRAEHAREVQVRTAALDDIPDDVLELLGPPPASRPERLTWESTVAEIAVYHERFGAPEAPCDPREAADVLGPRPSDAPARRAWDTAATLIEQAGATAPLPEPGITVVG
ncbi:MAG: MobF family relaxase [Actinomycetota bacterium]